ncbi:hypothetical protein FKM82_026700 [Ascaphus truei]
MQQFPLCLQLLPGTNLTLAKDDAGLDPDPYINLGYSSAPCSMGTFVCTRHLALSASAHSPSVQTSPPLSTQRVSTFSPLCLWAKHAVAICHPTGHMTY